MEFIEIMSAKMINVDCLVYMRQLPDKYFDLAIVDPPYGIGISKNPVRGKHGKKQWDNAIPSGEYFIELRRISGEQIIWGGNYFIEHLMPSRGFIVWDKIQPEKFSLAMCEQAWSSIQRPAKIFKMSVMAEKGKIHPTQKPVKLYEWLLRMYAKPGQKIFDSHMGSGSSAIACNNLGFEYIGCELDTDYFEAACKRILDHEEKINELIL